MYETHIDLAPLIRSRMIELLNARLADAIDLRLQLKVAHWNVKGPQFIALHKLFDEIAEDTDEYVDLIAERLVQLGGVADGTVRQVAERSSLDEYPATGGGEEHVHAVAEGLAAFGRLVREGIEVAAGAKDQERQTSSPRFPAGMTRGSGKRLCGLTNSATNPVSTSTL